MKIFNISRAFKENFTAKIFIVIALLIIIISISFTTFFINQQNKAINESLIREGELLTRMLAYNGRLGVFAENENLLKDPMEGIMQNRDVVRVRVLNYDGILLKENQKPSWDASSESSDKDNTSLRKIIGYLKYINEPYYFQEKDYFEFWSPVLTDSGYFTDETLLYSENSKKYSSNRNIGFVNVTLDKKVLNKTFNQLLFKSCVIAAICLIIGLIVAYWVAKAISRPLNRLTERVNAMGTDASVKTLPVETNDEIGKLASAFNMMAESLSKREIEKELLEEQIRHAQKMEAVGTLAGGVAHDFNNILTAIIGYGILLQNSLTGKSALSNYIEQMLAAAERAANLTQRLLAFSRKQVINPKPINLNRTIMNLFDILLRLIGENIELKLNLAKDDVIVKADESHMDQVIINLVTNAKDAMPNGGIITISSQVVDLPVSKIKGSDSFNPGIYGALIVSDTGKGIDPETRDRIFDPFFTTKEIGKGTGLGLSIVYGIVEQHNGFIELDTNSESGTTFTILLPFFEPTIEIKRMENLLLPRGNKEIVLLAEDDKLVRNLARHVLLRYGYHVVEAVNGEDAVNRFMENRDSIDILLLDVIMPKMNGRQAYDEINRLRPDVKALFMSGYPFEVMSRQGILEEGIHFISKPLQPGALLTKLREVLES
ncbi:MAG TPA: ATP-binding protein [Geobacteraceae bacterium]|nr:ATP-binding protein [Geobacteraceae bacterium]